MRVVNCFQDYSGKTFLPTFDLLCSPSDISQQPCGKGKHGGVPVAGYWKGRKEDPKFKAFKELNSAATILEADFLNVDLQIRWAISDQRTQSAPGVTLNWNEHNKPWLFEQLNLGALYGVAIIITREIGVWSFLFLFKYNIFIDSLRPLYMNSFFC